MATAFSAVRARIMSELTQIIQETLDKGGNVVIPSFAVGRTQEMLYFIRKIRADGLVSNHADFPVYGPVRLWWSNRYLNKTRN